MKILTVKSVEETRHETIPFKGKWYDLLGEPEQSGCWTIMGKSGSGKTRFILNLAAEFDRMGYRVLLVPLEMGNSMDYQSDLYEAGIRSGISKIGTCPDIESIEAFEQYLKGQRSADIIIIDSVQYLEEQYGVRAAKIIELRRKYRRKIFIFVAHVEGKEVKGATAYDVKKDSFRRILVEGFKATFMGRGKGGPKGYYIIWEKGYQEYWLQNINDNKDGNNYEDNQHPATAGTPCSV